jgi:hypothetical protein
MNKMMPKMKIWKLKAIKIILMKMINYQINQILKKMINFNQTF